MIENKIYNPAGQPKEWLIEHFVVRTKVFEKLFKDILNGTMKYPEQHYLIQGQRGMGKTTLLLRLKYEIENTPTLKPWLIPIFFSEESYDLTTLSNLWEKILKHLDDIFNTGGLYYKKTDEFLGQEDYEKKCFDYLIQILNGKKKKLIIFFDNFGQLFLDNLKEKEQHRLREILINCSDIRIIGASAVVLTDLHDYSKPFFDFFKIIKLEGLDKTETFQLIEKLQEKSENKINLKANKAKIETLAILTGGVIRTIMLIYEAILTDTDGTALRDLELILDRITPLYKHKIEDLPIQQRRIVDVIAKKWDAISTKEIAENIREDGKHVATKIISAQLQQLEKNNIIEKKQTNTKNHLYQLTERFFNIWYLMRHGDRNDRCKVIWLTKFLEMWYEDENGFNLFIIEHIKHLKTGNYHAGSALMIIEALANSEKLNSKNFEELEKETSAILNEDQKRLLPNIPKQKIEKVYELFENKKYEDIIEILKNDKNLNSFLKSILATSYYNINNREKSHQIINEIKPINDENNYALGLFYQDIGEFEMSNKFLKSSKNLYENMSHFLIGENYKFLGEFENAISYYIKALVLNKPEVYKSLIDTLFVTKKIEEAEKFTIQAIENGFIELNKTLVYIYIMYFDAKIKLDKAQAIINKGLNDNKTDPDFNYLKGSFEYFRGNAAKSLPHFLIAHKLYLKSKNKPVYFYINIHLTLNILLEEGVDKTTALDIIDSSTDLLMIDDLILYKSFINIWDGKYNVGIDLVLKYLKYNFEKETSEIKLAILQDVFLLLISKKQFHSVLKIFELPLLNLKDRFKPIYYTLMHFLKDEFPNEIIKMGEELHQPVNDITIKVDQMSIKYK